MGKDNMKYDEGKFLNQCHPAFKFSLERILGELTEIGWQPQIVSVKRTEAEQAEKVKAGYSKTMKSWHLDSTNAFIPFASNKFDIVHGNAADIIDKRYAWGGLASNKDFKFWKDLGKVAAKYGCAWGGNWKSFKDVAHIEMHFIEMPPQEKGYA